MTVNNTVTCCVCGELLSPPYNTINGRAYCARHYAAVNRPNVGAWQAGLIQIVGVAAVSAVVALIAGFLPPLSGAPLIVVGLIIALLPTVLWLIFFYRQDRLEP